jgi:polygalacturonase
LAEPATPATPQGIFNVREFGATGNGEVLDTQALQSAIDAAASSGGRVYFPPGTYRSGTLFLKSHVSLYLEAGAVLLGSTNLADFPSVQAPLRTYTEVYVHQSLIYAASVENVSLLGNGTIDGQGGAFKGGYGVRPYLIRMVNCRNVRVADLTLKDSPMWVQHYLACEDVSIRGLSVHSRCNANNDGIDIDACRKVRISDCEIFSGDDAIVLKSTLDRACQDVAVTNCVMSTPANGFKVGTESVGGFDNIVVSNCAIYDTGCAGIALETVDGATLENIVVSGIAMRNVCAPVFLRLGDRARPIYAGAPKPGLGSLRNVMIRDVQATGADKMGCAISGLPERPIEKVTLAGIRIRTAGGGSRAEAGRDIPENRSGYPEHNMFGVLPAYGFYCRHVKNLRILDTEFGVAAQDLRPALLADDAEGLRVSDLEAAKGSPVMLLRDTRNAWIESNRAPLESEVYLRVEGKRTENLCLAGNDLRGAKKPVELGAEVRTEAVVELPARGY